MTDFHDPHDSHGRSGDRAGDRPGMEQRLRAALNADAEQARVSPDAWSRIHRRLTSNTAQSTRPRGRRYALGLAAVTVTAVSVTGFLAVPRMLAPGSGDDLRPAARDGSQRPPVTATPTSTPSTTAAADVVLAELSAAEGTEWGVSLVLAEAPGGGTFLIPRERWEATSDATAGQRVGAPGRDASPAGVCELRLVQEEERTVRVRLASADGGGCSDPYEFRLEGDRLEPAGG